MTVWNIEERFRTWSPDKEFLLAVVTLQGRKRGGKVGDHA
jgi:hypothetical protein